MGYSASRTATRWAARPTNRVNSSSHGAYRKYDLLGMSENSGHTVTGPLLSGLRVNVQGGPRGRVFGAGLYACGL